MWTPIGLSRDIPAGVAAPILLAGRELVAWRTAAGDVRLFVDRCPHRGMRLSFGFVREDALVCLYHGWRWGEDGGCRAIPAHPDLVPPKSLVVERFAVHETGGLVFARLAGPDAPPPVITSGARPIGTLALDRSAEGLAASLGPGPIIAREVDGVPLLIGLQPVDAARAALHVLALDPGTAPRDALAAAEALRDRLEGEGAR